MKIFPNAQEYTMFQKMISAHKRVWGKLPTELVFPIPAVEKFMFSGVEIKLGETKHYFTKDNENIFWHKQGGQSDT